MARTEVIKVVVSPEEKAKAEQLAAARGLSLSSYLRQCITMMPTPPATTKHAA